MAQLVALGVIGYMMYRGKEKNMRLAPPPKKEYRDPANNRTKLLFDPQRLWKASMKLGNWPWDYNVAAPPTTKTWFRNPTPSLSGITDWSFEGNQWMRTQRFRDMYVKNYRNAWSTESQHATRNQLVNGYWKELIAKGRVLTQDSTATGTYNPNGPNLYLYHKNEPMPLNYGHGI